MKRGWLIVLLVLSLIGVGAYAYFSMVWIQVKYERSTGADFSVLDNTEKVRVFYGDRPNVNYGALFTDVQTDTESGYLTFEEYYLYGQYNSLTCESAPNCKVYYLSLTNCIIVPTVLIQIVGVTSLIFCSIILLFFILGKLRENRR